MQGESETMRGKWWIGTHTTAESGQAPTYAKDALRHFS